MRLAGHDCGCDARREVMFTYGNGHVVVAALAVAAVVLIVISYKRGS